MIIYVVRAEIVENKITWLCIVTKDMLQEGNSACLSIPSNCGLGQSTLNALRKSKVGFIQ